MLAHDVAGAQTGKRLGGGVERQDAPLGVDDHQPLWQVQQDDTELIGSQRCQIALHGTLSCKRDTAGERLAREAVGQALPLAARPSVAGPAALHERLGDAVDPHGLGAPLYLLRT